MENDIIARAEQLGHEAEGLHYFYYDTILPNPIIVEEVLERYDRLDRRYNNEGETVYLVFKDDTSKLKPAYRLSYIEKLLSGEVIETQAHCICRDRAKLVARIEEQQKEELRRQQLEKMSSVDWEERTWTLLNDLVVSNLQLADSEAVYTLDELVCIARETVNKYKKSMEEEKE